MRGSLCGLCCLRGFHRRCNIDLAVVNMILHAPDEVYPGPYTYKRFWFRDAVFITAAYGLGENVVQGAVNPDEFYVFKPTLLHRYAPEPAARDSYQPSTSGTRNSRLSRMATSERSSAKAARSVLEFRSS